MEYVVGGARFKYLAVCSLHVPVKETVGRNGGVELGARGLCILGTPYISSQA